MGRTYTLDESWAGGGELGAEKREYVFLLLLLKMYLQWKYHSINKSVNNE